MTPSAVCTQPVGPGSGVLRRLSRPGIRGVESHPRCGGAAGDRDGRGLALGRSVLVSVRVETAASPG